MSAVAVFVKTIGLSPLKTRLAKSIGTESAESFYRLSVEAIQKSLEEWVSSELTRNRTVAPYWSVAEREGMEKWNSFSTVWQGEGDLGARLENTYSQLYRHYGRVFFLGGDCPHFDPQVLTQAQNFLDENKGFILAPSSDGGFYLFGGNCEIPAEVWKSVPYSKSNTCGELQKAIEGMGSIEILDENFDIDEIEDLERLKKYLSHLRDEGGVPTHLFRLAEFLGL